MSLEDNKRALELF